jgi:hypothetical protein
MGPIIGVLGDDAREPQLAGVLKDRRAVAGQVLVEQLWVKAYAVC